ncbi:MAG: hypothetical protein IKS32_12155 [Solobacterium sp.]|nr:hypothetical protein [Solobacterium sp.]
MIELELRIPIQDSGDPIDRAVKKYHIRTEDVRSVSITRRSLDARPNHPAAFLYQITFELNNEASFLSRNKKTARSVTPFRYQLPERGDEILQNRPVIAGFGPCGMAAGLLLAKAGYRPLILERGPKTEDRVAAVDHYWKTGILDTRRNVQFGEGGAGAFSDGKLTTRVKDPRVALILQELIRAGADPSIAWLNHPHIGTDRFRSINIAIRSEIESLGGEIRFETAMQDLVIQNGRLCAVITEQGEELPAEALILAIGHSARDTFHMLNRAGLALSAKQFAAGLRCEHLQEFINARQYRNISDPSVLPPAEYHLSHTSSFKKGVYSFCMCPGGYVIPAESTEQTIVTNGMSYSRRDGKNANSALVIQVDPSDYGEGLFAGLEFQERLEHAAYRLGNGKAPCETIAHYLDPSASNTPSSVLPTYALGTEMTDLSRLFSPVMNQSLKEMLVHTESIFPGFTTEGALFTGVETRTSSPIRIIRDSQTLESSTKGIFPSGEGAGYAGGIVSSAIDGVRCAEKILQRYRPFV